MRWKTQTIIVRPGALDGGPDKLVADLGYAKRRRIDVTSLLYAGGGSFWIGSVGDCVVIETPYAWSLLARSQLDDENCVDFWNALLRRFSAADIALFALDSVVEGWGFALFRRATLVRCQYGYDGAVLHDEGSPLPVERAYVARLQRADTDDGEIAYRDPDDPEDLMGASELGQSLVYEICQSFTGYSLHDLDDQAHGANFWVNDDEAIYRSKFSPRPWWKFWGASI